SHPASSNMTDEASKTTGPPTRSLIMVDHRIGRSDGGQAAILCYAQPSMAVFRRMMAVAALVASAKIAHAADPGRFARDLTARRDRFAKEGARPQAAVPLLGAITDLWDALDDRTPLVRFLDEAAQNPKARADVRSRAAWLRSLLMDRMGQAS